LSLTIERYRRAGRRFYITLSTTKISKYITPSITYYQTVYSQGDNRLTTARCFMPRPKPVSPTHLSLFVQ